VRSRRAAVVVTVACVLVCLVPVLLFGGAIAAACGASERWELPIAAVGLVIFLAARARRRAGRHGSGESTPEG
jgi:hypothetical protein